MDTQPYTLMTADVYDAIYADKDYASEAKTLKDVINHFKKADGNELLDVACGTGQNLPHLIDGYQITGLDLSEQQLEAARKRLPGLTFVQGDMRDFDLGRQFDVVTCLFSSIGYAQPLPEMQKAIANMTKHVKPGGVLIVEPWLQPGVFDPDRPPHTDVGKHPTKDLEVTRTTHNSLEGNVSILKMVHEVKTPEGVRNFTEEHRLALYTPKEYQSAFESAGLQFNRDEHGLSGRGLYIGQKPLQ